MAAFRISLMTGESTQVHSFSPHFMMIQKVDSLYLLQGSDAVELHLFTFFSLPCHFVVVLITEEHELH